MPITVSLVPGTIVWTRCRSMDTSVFLGSSPVGTSLKTIKTLQMKQTLKQKRKLPILKEPTWWSVLHELATGREFLTSGFSCSLRVCRSTYLLLSGATIQGSKGQGSSPAWAKENPSKKNNSSANEKNMKQGAEGNVLMIGHLRHMVTWPGNDGTSKPWSTRHSLDALAILAHQSYVCGLGLDSRSSDRNPRYLNKPGHVLGLKSTFKPIPIVHKR